MYVAICPTWDAGEGLSFAIKMYVIYRSHPISS